MESLISLQIPCRQGISPLLVLVLACQFFVSSACTDNEEIGFSVSTKRPVGSNKLGSQIGVEQAGAIEISDQEISSNSPTTVDLNIPIQGFDGPCDNGMLSYSIDNKSILDSAAGVKFSGNFPNCKITFQPGSATEGSSLVTLKLEIGGASAERAFRVTLKAPSAQPGSVASADSGISTAQEDASANAVNSPPTISSIDNQSISEDSNTGALGFTIADVDSTVLCSSVTATSSNTTLIPNANIVVAGGISQSCTVTVTPEVDQNGGPVTVSLSISDGALTATSSFTVSITPVNDAPRWPRSFKQQHC